MPGVITRADHQREVQRQLELYAETVVRRLLERQQGGFVAPQGGPGSGGGTERVEGYRRSDGTYVAAYYRRG